MNSFFGSLRIRHIVILSCVLIIVVALWSLWFGVRSAPSQTGLTWLRARTIAEAVTMYVEDNASNPPLGAKLSYTLFSGNERGIAYAFPTALPTEEDGWFLDAQGNRLS